MQPKGRQIGTSQNENHLPIHSFWRNGHGTNEVKVGVLNMNLGRNNNYNIGIRSIKNKKRSINFLKILIKNITPNVKESCFPLPSIFSVPYPHPHPPISPFNLVSLQRQLYPTSACSCYFLDYLNSMPHKGKNEQFKNHGT